ncbi:antibiotic biosynthesis monooxygenase family protein [Bryobacter aggregatus]|uniref:antibiotic biosynthesis monooxygenase family protein n=1 Tax=Bryobacter aggregatus TaxID=360054 RepID=UPI0004E15E71|nr:antibiotic biosynthesis monooxygenase [Bryobacter aggregatus]
MTLSPIFEPPYYAVIFTSLRHEGDHGYGAMAEEMEKLGSAQPGYLGIDSARSEVGITVSYWQNLADIHAWKAQLEHQQAQRLGKEQWYASYTVRVAKVEYNYEFGR